MNPNHRPLARVITGALGVLMGGGAICPDVSIEQERPVKKYDLDRIEAARAKRERRRLRNLSK